MQYYIKMFNTTTHTCVGYYKDTGRSNITRYPNGMKYFNDYEDALKVLEEIDDCFVRDADGHYYTCFAIIKGDSSREYDSKKKNKKFLNGEDREEYVKNFIRKDFSSDSN